MTDRLYTPKSILFGPAFYEEYQPTDNLEEDFRLLKAAHMNVIRVGEGSWSHWEPEDGRFELDWLQPVLDKAQETGINVIIGVPTFAIPQWLVRKYPEVALTDEHGHKRFFGGREEHSLSHPVFRFYAERVIRKIVERYANHPSVIGWQLHNEPGLWLNYSHDAFEGFKDWLRHRYGTVEKLNKEWGLVYWSHELSTWDDLWMPEGNAQPQYDIEWRRYQAELTDELLGWQRDLITSLCPENQFITVNHALGRDATNEVTASRTLDIAGSDPYFEMQDGLRLPDPDQPEHSWHPAGPWSLALMGDRTYSLKQQPYFVLENNGGPIGGSADNRPGYDGQWKQAAWQFISRGAEMIEYWHWQQLHYGTETYWGGILPHDRKPGRVFEQVADLGRDLEAAGDAVVGLTPDADITVLYSVESRWALAYEPHVSPGGDTDPHKDRNPKAYDDTLTAFYKGAYISGRQMHLVQDEQIIDPETREVLQPADAFTVDNPVLLVAGAYVTSDEMLAWLRDYAAAGGHLILGPRSTYADLLARPRLDVKPARLSGEADVTYQEFCNLRHDVPAVEVTDGDGETALPLRDGAAATDWIDCLIPQGAQTLVAADHPHYGNFPLVTTAASGKGRVTIVGTVPNAALAASVYDYALGPEAGWITDHPTVSHSSAVNAKGERIHFLFNWNWAPVGVDLPVTCTPLLSDVEGAEGGPVNHVDLGAWGVTLLVERD